MLIKTLKDIIKEEEIDKQRLEQQIEWNKQREQALKQTRHIKRTEELHAEGILLEDDYYYKTDEDLQYSFLEDDFKYEVNQRIDCSAGGLFGQPRKKIGIGLVDNVAKLIYSSEWENSWKKTYEEEFLAERLEILEKIGFVIPNKLKNMEEIYRGYKKYKQERWIYKLGRDFETFLKEKHPKLHKYWLFTSTVYMLAN